MSCTRRGGPRTPSRTTDANLDCAFVENSLVFVFPKIGRARLPLVPPPLHDPLNGLVLVGVYCNRFTRNVDLMGVTSVVGLSPPATASETTSTSSTCNSSLISAKSVAGGSRENQNSTITSGRFSLALHLFHQSCCYNRGICSRSLAKDYWEQADISSKRHASSFVLNQQKIQFFQYVLLTYTMMAAYKYMSKSGKISPIRVWAEKQAMRLEKCCKKACRYEFTGKHYCLSCQVDI